MPCNTCKEAHGYEKVVAPAGHVAFVVGAAFGSVVKAFADVLFSLFGKVVGNLEFNNVTRGGVPVGASLTATVAFLIVAAVVYFFVVTPYQAAVQGNRGRRGPDEDVVLLTERRDLLARSVAQQL